jgi:hypothetical protein
MWIKASERRPTGADAVDGWVFWRTSKDDPAFVGRWDIPFVAYEWCRILYEPEPAQEPELPQLGQMIWVRKFDEEMWQKKTLMRWKVYPVTASRSGESELIWHEWSLTDPNKPPEPAQEPYIKPGQIIWVRDTDKQQWRKRRFVRGIHKVVCTAVENDEYDVTWEQWSLTDPNEPPELQYRPFKNAEEFWPFRDCWWRNKQSPESRPPCPFTCDRYGGWSWQACFEKMELLEDIDGKMVARPFGMLIEPETNIS